MKRGRVAASCRLRLFGDVSRSVEIGVADPETRYVLSQIRMREPLIRYSIAAFVLLFGVLGLGMLFMPGGAQGSLPRSVIVGVFAASTIPVAFVVSRVHLATMWWSKAAPIKGINTAFVIYADVGLTTVLVCIRDPMTALIGSTLFAVIGGYVSHFVKAWVLIAHTAFASVVIIGLAISAWVMNGSAVTAIVAGTVALIASHGVIGLHRNYTDQFQAALRAQVRSASTDHLTRLLNRRGFTYWASESLSHGGPVFCLLVADVDEFKSINDVFGHAVGDAILTHAARHVSDSAGDAAVVGRLGGDEFAIAIPHGRSEGVALAVELNRNPPEIVNGHRISFSVGVAVCVTQGWPRDWQAANANVEAAIDLADRQLLVAKSAGRNTYRAVDVLVEHYRR